MPWHPIVKFLFLTWLFCVGFYFFDCIGNKIALGAPIKWTEEDEFPKDVWFKPPVKMYPEEGWLDVHKQLVKLAQEGKCIRVCMMINTNELSCSKIEGVGKEEDCRGYKVNR